jgi:mannose/fructose-specific phosphotransferase system component IIA
VVAGLNLSMILNVFNYPKFSLEKLANKAIEGGIEGIMDL